MVKQTERPRPNGVKGSLLQRNRPCVKRRFIIRRYPIGSCKHKQHSDWLIYSCSNIHSDRSLQDFLKSMAFDSRIIRVVEQGSSATSSSKKEQWRSTCRRTQVEQISCVCVICLTTHLHVAHWNWNLLPKTTADTSFLLRTAVRCITFLYKQYTGFFMTTTEIHVRSLVKFYCQYANRHMNLQIMRRICKREQAIRQFVIVKNKLMSVFNASVLLLTMNFVITLSKLSADPQLLWQCYDEIHDQ